MKQYCGAVETQHPFLSSKATNEKADHQRSASRLFYTLGARAIIHLLLPQNGPPA